MNPRMQSEAQSRPLSQSRPHVQSRTRPRVAVIGGGVIGAATARALAADGARVTLYERTAPGSGTTGTTFAWVNSHAKNPRPYHDLNTAGLAEHHALHRTRERDGARGPQWFFPTGNLEWAAQGGRGSGSGSGAGSGAASGSGSGAASGAGSGAGSGAASGAASGAGSEDARARLAESVARLTDRGYPVSWLDPDEARALVPDLRIPAGVDRIAHYPDEGHIHPHLLLARLWGEARDHGAQLACPAEVVGLDTRPAGVRLTLADGTTADADLAVLATGRWTARTTALLGAPLPMADPDEPGSATVGLLGWTTPTAARLDRVLTTPRLNVRPDGGGRLVLQGLDLDAYANPARPPAADGWYAAELLARLGELLHGSDGARLESLRVGQRALPADGLTAAGFLDGGGPGRGPGGGRSGGRSGGGRAGRSVYVLATHSGITLGPLLGRLAARELLHGERDALLDGFGPERLLNADPGPDGFTPLRPARFAGQQ